MKGAVFPRSVATLACLLGAAHLALTPLAYRGWEVDSLWFVGAGLAICFAAVANLVMAGRHERKARAALFLINLSMTSYFAAAYLILPEPQVIAGAAIFAALTLNCLVARGDATKTITDRSA